jgi:hypothetical protein
VRRHRRRPVACVRACVGAGRRRGGARHRMTTVRCVRTRARRAHATRQSRSGGGEGRGQRRSLARNERAHPHARALLR